MPDAQHPTGPAHVRGAPTRPGGDDPADRQTEHPGDDHPSDDHPTDDQDGATVSPSETSPLDALLDVATREGLAVVDTDAGRVVFVPQARYDALTGGSDASGRTGPVTLTPREAEILSRVARGDGTAAISSDLGVAMNTVAQHLVAVRRKYGVHSSTLAVEAARRDGLI